MPGGLERSVEDVHAAGRGIVARFHATHLWRGKPDKQGEIHTPPPRASTPVKGLRPIVGNPHEILLATTVGRRADLGSETGHEDGGPRVHDIVAGRAVLPSSS